MHGVCEVWSVVLVGASLAALGLWAQRSLMDANKCAMTYSYPVFEPVPVANASVSGYSLLRHFYVEDGPDGQGVRAGDAEVDIEALRKQPLRPVPVLFVPGHAGSAFQGRSLASFAHSQVVSAKLQFFALDFPSPLGSRSAVHGAEVFAQAAFLNDALRTIQKLYKDSKGVSNVEVVVIAHSMGGTVARSAALLSNHPSGCPVRNLLLLGSPVARPAVGIDASMDALYTTLNRAWRASFYTQSSACLEASHASSAQNDVEFDDPQASMDHAPSGGVGVVGGEDDRLGLSAGNKHSRPLAAHWRCGRCIAGMRIVSVTGGLIDYLVPDHITHLKSIVPSPKNFTAGDPKSVPILKALKPKGGFVRYLFGKARALLLDTGRAVEERFFPDSRLFREDGALGNASATPSAAAEPVSEGEKDGAGASRVRYNSRDSFRLSVTEEQWSRDMALHAEPQYVSLRTGMMASLGFVVDHDALLWCSQLVSSVLGITKQLLEVPKSRGHRIGLPLVDLSSSVAPGDAHRRRLENSALDEHEEEGGETIGDDPSIWLDVPDEKGATVHDLRGVLAPRYAVLDASLLPANDSAKELSDFVVRARKQGAKLRKEQRLPQVIEPVAAAVRRHCTYLVWKRAAENERAAMMDFFESLEMVGAGSATSNPILAQLSNLTAAAVRKAKAGWLIVALIVFGSQKLHTIIVSYLFIACLVLTVPVLRRASLGGASQTEVASGGRQGRLERSEDPWLDRMERWLVVSQPSVHLHLAFINKGIVTFLGETWFPRLFFAPLRFPIAPRGAEDIPVVVWKNVLIHVSAIALAVIYSDAVAIDRVQMLHVIGPIFSTALSYSLGLLLWVFIGMVIITMQGAIDLTFHRPMAAIARLLTRSHTAKANEDPSIDVDALKRARRAGDASNTKGSSVSVLSYILGDCDDGLRRPSALRLLSSATVFTSFSTLLILIATSEMGSVGVKTAYRMLSFSRLSAFLTGPEASLIMRVLCAFILLMYPVFIGFWVYNLAVPIKKGCAPHWLSDAKRGATSPSSCSSIFSDDSEWDDAAPKRRRKNYAQDASHENANDMMAYSLALTLPVLVLAYPTFEFAMETLCSGATVPYVVEACVVAVARVLFNLLSASPIRPQMMALVSEYGFDVAGSTVFNAKPFFSAHHNAPALRELNEIFGPGMIYVAAALYFCTLLLIIVRSEPVFDSIRPAAWLCEIQASGSEMLTKIAKNLSPRASVATNSPSSHPEAPQPQSVESGTRNIGSKRGERRRGGAAAVWRDAAASTSSASGHGGCFHEDGGKFAVFECVEEQALDISAAGDGSVLAGSMFKVVYCRCFADTSLTKGRVEWCEWCRCADCGGKAHPHAGEASRKGNGGGTWGDVFAKLPDLNADIGLLFGLVFVAAFDMVYVGDSLFKILQILAAYGLVFFLHRVAVFFGF